MVSLAKFSRDDMVVTHTLHVAKVTGPAFKLDGSTMIPVIIGFKRTAIEPRYLQHL